MSDQKPAVLDRCFNTLHQEIMKELPYGWSIYFGLDVAGYSIVLEDPNCDEISSIKVVQGDCTKGEYILQLIEYAKKHDKDYD